MKPKASVMYILYRIACLIIPFYMGSCATNTSTGLFAGGALGAGIGGIAAGAPGALIGSATGLLMGSVTGYALDEQDRKMLEQSSPRTIDRMDHGEPLTLNDVIKLSQAGVPDGTIMQYMQLKKTNYSLTQTQIRRLRESGVSQRLIHYMMSTEK